MIKPTVGRVMWYWRRGSHPSDAPLPVLVNVVCDDNTVHVAGFDAEGQPFSARQVAIQQDAAKHGHPAGEDCPDQWVEWMPYQQGQAAKADAEKAATTPPPAKP